MNKMIFILMVFLVSCSKDKDSDLLELSRKYNDNYEQRNYATAKEIVEALDYALDTIQRTI